MARVLQTGSRAMRWLAVIGPAVLLLAWRGVTWRSAAHQLYAGEAAGVGRLPWALSQGTFEWHGPTRFVIEHTYQYFATGTAFLQVVGWLLSPLFGHTYAGQVAAGTTLEAVGVAVFAALILRVSDRPGLAALATLPLIFAPRFVVSFALQPYGNHTEYVVIPLLAALWLARGHPPEDRGWGDVVGLGALLGVGVVLYRLNVAPAAAAICVLAAGRSARGAAQGAAAVLGAAVTASLLFWPLGLSPLGWDPGGLGSFPADRPRWEAIPDLVHFTWSRGLPGVHVAGDLGRTQRVVLILGVLAASLAWLPNRGPKAESEEQKAYALSPERRGRRDVARFAALWAVAAIAAPVVTGSGMPRYFLPAYTACTLALAVQLGSLRLPVRAGAASVLGLVALAGLLEGRGLIDRSTWERELPSYDLWFVLELDTLDADELPYYRRILDEGRGNPWVGRVSHQASNRCGRWAGSDRDDGPPAADHCSGWDRGDLAMVLADVERRTSADERRQSLMDVGRGAWIRSNRKLAEVEAAIEGTSPELAEAVMAGARDEARRWQD